jgi:serine protease Do
MKQLFFIAFLLLLLSFSAAAANDSVPVTLWREGQIGDADPDLERLGTAFTRLAEKVQPAVVQIRSNGKPPAESDKESQTPRTSRGSGFIINGRGYILTAYHVIEGAKEIEVRLPGRERLPAQVVGVDPNVDLAIIKIDPTRELPVLPLGESKNIRVGELAASVAYPFGRDSSLSVGVISRASRKHVILSGFDFIQTDAGASPGSSGGPLVNMKGHVVGMITMASSMGNAGFAVPIDVIKSITPRLLKGEKIVWGWLGVRVSDVTLDLAQRLGLSPVRGVLISSVLPDQPAAKSQLLPQDIILSINGVDIDSPRDLTRIVSGSEAGKEVQLTIFRRGKIFQLAVLLGVRPPSSEGREG